MSDWTEENIKHRDFQHSDRPEDWETVKHRRKANKGCKKSSDRQHDYSNEFKRWLGYNGKYYWVVLECSKCHKHKWTVEDI